MRYHFAHPNRKSVFCIRDRDGHPGLVDITVLPAKGKGYHLYPGVDHLSTCLLRECGLSELEAKNRAPCLAATPLLRRRPPWQVTESELRAFILGLEAFMQGGAA